MPSMSRPTPTVSSLPRLACQQPGTPSSVVHVVCGTLQRSAGLGQAGSTGVAPPAPRRCLQALLLCLLATLLPAPAACAGQTLHSNKTAPPLSCTRLFGYDMGTDTFDYFVGYRMDAAVPPGCTVSISRLYMEGVCSSLRNNEASGCGNSSGTPASRENSTCEAVLRDAPPDTWIVMTGPTLPANAPNMFDAGLMECTATRDAHFYVHNTCNASIPFTAVLRTYGYTPCRGGDSKAVMALAIIGSLLCVMLFSIWIVYAGKKNHCCWCLLWVRTCCCPARQPRNADGHTYPAPPPLPAVAPSVPPALVSVRPYSSYAPYTGPLPFSSHPAAANVPFNGPLPNAPYNGPLPHASPPENCELVPLSVAEVPVMGVPANRQAVVGRPFRSDSPVWGGQARASGGAGAAV